MTRIYIFLILIIFNIGNTSYALEDKVIAIVNNHVVLESELSKKLATMEINKLNKLQAAKLRNDVLNSLIEESLLDQAAARYNIIISDIDLQNQVQQIAKQQNITVLQLKDIVESQNITYAEYLNKLRKKISIQELFRTQFTNRAFVSEEEIQSYIKNNDLLKSVGSKMDIREYLLEDESGSLEISKVNIFFESIKKIGLDEARVKYPDIDVKMSNLKNITMNELPDIYRNNLQILDNKNFSNLFKTGRGYTFLEVLESNILINEYKVSHILLKTNPMEDISMIKSKLYQIQKDAMENNNFEKYAKEFSLDKVSAMKGGSLGWMTKDKVVSSFSKVMMETPIGEISEPFKTRFGWHILYLEDKRIKNITNTILRNQAITVLKERKVEVGKKEWLSKLKDQAYIEIVR
tara:strand:- start:1325 stop:2545 length:1221 start_codon:yes stop_codon:yes gene_type:complete